MISLESNSTPLMIYGTAWKAERTAELVVKALEAGFRAINTAAQPKHYREDLVGDAIRDCIQRGLFEREDIYIQTKFTPLSGQDPFKLPYDATASLVSQVRTSVQSSLHNFRLDSALQPQQAVYIDCVILHSPLRTLATTLEAWETLSAFVPTSIRTLGISNVTLPVLKALYNSVNVKPKVVQNRFHAATGYDREIRAFCKERSIIYEGFWTLTRNPHLVGSEFVEDVAERIGVERQAALYGLIGGLGGTKVLNGTTSEHRMAADLNGVERLRRWAAEESNEDTWKEMVQSFGKLIGDAQIA